MWLRWERLRARAKLSSAALALLAAGCGAAPGLQVQRTAPRSARDALRAATQTPSKCASGRQTTSLGQVAYIRDGSLRLASLATCRTDAVTLVAHGVTPPVRFSADGRWVAYGDGTVASTRRREIVRPLGQRAITWAWLGGSDEMVGVTEGGGLVVGEPGRAPRMLLADGWNATSIVTASDGRIAVSRAAPHPEGRVEGSASIWTLSLTHPKPIRGYEAPAGTAELKLAQFAPGGRYFVFWVNRWGSASLAEDGLPLELAGPGHESVPVTLSTSSPVRREDLASCGERLVFVVGGSREATFGKRLASAAAVDGWQAEDVTDGARSAASPTCAPNGGMLAAAIGPNRAWIAGAEHRSIELLSRRRSRLSSPSEHSSDESPRFAGHGRWILFIRSRYRAGGAGGAGYLVSTRSSSARAIGPLFTTGPGSDHYGSYDWGETVAFLPAEQRRR